MARSKKKNQLIIMIPIILYCFNKEVIIKVMIEFIVLLLIIPFFKIYIFNIE